MFLFPAVFAEQPDLDAVETLIFNWFRKCVIPARRLTGRQRSSPGVKKDG